MGITLLWVLLSLLAVSVAIAILPSVLWGLGIFFIIILIVYILWFVINFIVWIAPVVFFIAMGSIIWGIINKMTGRPTGFHGAGFHFGLKDKFSRRSKKRKNKIGTADYEAEKNRILDELNNGDISVEEAMRKLEELKNKYM
jgi:signal transduction histidine kinase